MSRLFYPKLAADNIKKNAQTYLPYVLTCIFTVTLFYMMRALSLNDGLKSMVGADSINYAMKLGCWIAAFFSTIFLFYTNSFLMKRRKKEFGLFHILGMEKKHLARVVGLETLYIAVLSLVAGLVLGIALDKVMYLLILRVLGFAVPLGFSISIQAIGTTVLLFGAIFLLILLNALWQIHLTKPIELLRSQQVGEREPKTKWLMALVGVACVGSGYYISVTIQNPVAVMMLFFVAVILVIVGTYLLFTAGSIVVLKLLRQNKTYYYQTKHFISVSGMLYRMKQNAVGLANICILATMVLVMISSTLSMMLGMADILATRYPYDLAFYAEEAEAQHNSTLLAEVERIVADDGLSVERSVDYSYLEFLGIQEGHRFITEEGLNQNVTESINNLIFIPLSDYNRLSGHQQTLEEGQILLYSNREAFDYPTLRVFDRNYSIVAQVDDFLGNGQIAANIVSSRFIVVQDMAEVRHLEAAQKAVYGSMASTVRRCHGFDLSGDDAAQQVVADQVFEAIKQGEYALTMESRADSRDGFTADYGGMFFLGIFLGTLFIVATVLIIYYKQVSEGYDDKERFAIMQQVGMSHAEVKKAIHTQILIVFFLPLLTAGIHLAFAFPVITKILAMLNLTNTRLFMLCALGCFLVFALLYGGIYAVTAKVYYRIVSR